MTFSNSNHQQAGTGQPVVDPELLVFNQKGELNPGWEAIECNCEGCEQQTEQWMKRETPDGVEATSICSCCGEQYMTFFPETR